MGTLRPSAGKAIVQFSFIDALVAGLYDGAFAASEVASTGTIGIGCGDALDGELLLLDGEMLVCRGDGTVTAVSPHELLPFAEVAPFEPTHTETVGSLSEREFEQFIEALVPSDNLFYAIRVDGEFESLTVREATQQQRPFRGLAEATRDQRESSIVGSTGTMVGFKGPDVFQGLSVADLHLHFVDEARAFGGHVLDFVLASGVLSIEAYSSFTLRLPEVESYLSAELDDISADEEIRRAEGS